MVTTRLRRGMGVDRRLAQMASHMVPMWFLFLPEARKTLGGDVTSRIETACQFSNQHREHRHKGGGESTKGATSRRTIANCSEISVRCRCNSYVAGKKIAVRTFVCGGSPTSVDWPSSNQWDTYTRRDPKRFGSSCQEELFETILLACRISHARVQWCVGSLATLSHRPWVSS